VLAKLAAQVSATSGDRPILLVCCVTVILGGWRRDASRPARLYGVSCSVPAESRLLGHSWRTAISLAWA